VYLCWERWEANRERASGTRSSSAAGIPLRRSGGGEGLMILVGGFEMNSNLFEFVGVKEVMGSGLVFFAGPWRKLGCGPSATSGLGSFFRFECAKHASTNYKSTRCMVTLAHEAPAVGWPGCRVGAV
jgi:hypothetical protein